MRRFCKTGIFLGIGLCLLFSQAFANSTANLTFVNVGPGNVAAGNVYAYP